MPKSVNKVILLGNVGKEPEVRVLPSGTILANFTLATSERRKDGRGEYLDVTEWHNIVAFERLAEVVRDYVNKGSKLYLEGKLRTRSWDDKESGVKKYRTEVVVHDLGLLGSPNGISRSNAHNSSTSQPPQHADVDSVGSREYDEVGITDRDIPF